MSRSALDLHVQLNVSFVEAVEKRQYFDLVYSLLYKIALMKENLSISH